MDERTAIVNIGGQEYEMLLTTRATKAIAGRYGGLENLGEKLMKAENFEMALDEIVWRITLLCNQPILVHNLKHPEDKKPELTAEEVELLTSPMELTDYKDAIMEAMYRGTKRNIESEPEGKNTAAGEAMKNCLPGFCITAWPTSPCAWRKCGSCRLACSWICGNATGSFWGLRSQNGN